MKIRPRLEEGWSTLFLLWAMMMVSAMAIARADLIFGLHVIPLVGTIALLAGTLLAKSRFSPNNAHIFALIYGLFTVFLVVGTIDTFAGMPWRDRILHPTDGIISRQLIWLQKLVNGGTSRDGFIFVFQTSFIYWGLGYTAAWYTFRQPRVWRAVVPSGLVLLSVVYYYGGPRPLEYYLAIYLLLALLFVARTYLVEQEKGWLAGAIRYEKGIWFNFVRAGFIIALLALAFTWRLPPLSASATVGDALNGARGPWREFQDNWTRMFSALRTYGTNTTDPYQDTLVLGGPRTVGNTAVMDIIVPRELPYVYWQAKVYQIHQEDGSWDSLDESFTEHFPDEGPISQPFTADREVITQTVVSYLPNSSFIYGAPDIIDVDRPINVYASRDGSGNQLVSQIRSKFVLQLGDQYEVTSRLSLADATSLRAAGTDYPDWVKETYLQLSDSVTPETLDLAEELATPHDNPFDKAIAVRDYLRKNIVYNDQIQATPEGFDPVHYTLFVSQEAYCNYYASAMAVMLRSQGVPARVVAGYAQGSFDEESSSYRVQASNSHTWVEVFFPGYGWIQFEPTASIPAWDRPETIDEGGSGGDAFSAFSAQNFQDREQFLGEELEDPSDSTLDEDLLADLLAEEAAAAEPSFWETFPVWQALGGILILAVAISLSYAANEMNKRVEGDVDKSFSRLRSWASWLGLPVRTTDTPYEQADLLTTAVPQGKEPIRSLTKQFVLKQFSPAKAFEDGFNPLTQWQQLRPILIRQTLAKKMDNLRNRRKNRRQL